MNTMSPVLVKHIYKLFFKGTIMCYLTVTMIDEADEVLQIDDRDIGKFHI
jgi:hypothetical protein